MKRKLSTKILKLFLCASVLSLTIGSSAFAADRFWVGSEGGCDGEFGTSACWSTTKTGSGGASVPSTSDTAYFTHYDSADCSMASSAANVDILNLNHPDGSYTGTITLKMGYTVIANEFEMGNSGTFNANEGSLEINGDFKLLGTTSGTFVAPPIEYSFQVTGDVIISNESRYTHNSGRLTLLGDAQTLYGTATYYELVKPTGSQLSFEAGESTTVMNLFQASGDSVSARLALNSTSPGTQWNIELLEAYNLQLVSVQDSNSLNGLIELQGTDSISLGNNTGGWTFDPVAAIPEFSTYLYLLTFMAGAYFIFKQKKLINRNY